MRNRHLVVLAAVFVATSTIHGIITVAVAKIASVVALVTVSLTKAGLVRKHNCGSRVFATRSLTRHACLLTRVVSRAADAVDLGTASTGFGLGGSSLVRDCGTHRVCATRSLTRHSRLLARVTGWAADAVDLGIAFGGFELGGSLGRLVVRNCSSSHC